MITKILELIPNYKQLLISLILMIVSFGIGLKIGYNDSAREALVKEQLTQINSLINQNKQLNLIIDKERRSYEIINNKSNELQQSLESSVNDYNKIKVELNSIKNKLNDTNRINKLFMRIISKGTDSKQQLSKDTGASCHISESEAITTVQPAIAAEYIIDNFQYCNTVIIKYNNLIDFYNEIESNFNKGN